MKKSALVFLIFFLTASVTAQVTDLSERQHFEGGDWEALIAVALGLSASSTESSNFYPSYGEDKQFFFELSVTPGFYIIDGLSLEPELDMKLFGTSSLSLIGNISYTFHIPGEEVYPFLRIGFGKSSFMCEDSFGSFNSNVFSAGGGLKIIQSASFAVRLEVNYKRFISNRTYYYTETDNIKYFNSGVGIKFGGSFLF
jgi:hypothetical protein